jgi:hypothetical protein
MRKIQRNIIIMHISLHVQYSLLSTYSTHFSPCTVLTSLHVQYSLLSMYSTHFSPCTVLTSFHVQYSLLSMYSTHLSRCTVLTSLLRLQFRLEFFDRFSKRFQITNFMKIRPAAADFFQSNKIKDRRIYRNDKPNAFLSQSCECV